MSKRTSKASSTNFKVTPSQKKRADSAAKKIVKQYGKTLKLLAQQ